MLDTPSSEVSRSTDLNDLKRFMHHMMLYRLLRIGIPYAALYLQLPFRPLVQANICALCRAG